MDVLVFPDNTDKHPFSHSSFLIYLFKRCWFQSDSPAMSRCLVAHTVCSCDEKNNDDAIHPTCFESIGLSSQFFPVFCNNHHPLDVFSQFMVFFLFCEIHQNVRWVHHSSLCVSSLIFFQNIKQDEITVNWMQFITLKSFHFFSAILNNILSSGDQLSPSSTPSPDAVSLSSSPRSRRYTQYTFG